MSFLGLFKKSFRLISHKRFLFLGIMLIQFLAIMGIALVGLIYLPRIMDTTHSIINTISTSTPELPHGSDPLGVYRNYQVLKISLFQMTTIMVGVFLFLSGLLWALSHHLVRKKRLRSIFIIWADYILLGIIYIVIGAVSSFFLFKDTVIDMFSTGLLNKGAVFGFALLFWVLLYFFTWSSALLHLKSPWKIIKATFSIQRKAILLALVFVTAALMGSVAGLVAGSISSNVFLLSLGITLQMAVFAWAKLFIITTGRGILKESVRR